MVTPSLEVTAPTGITLTMLLGLIEIRLTEAEQLPPIAIAAPLTAIEVPPATALTEAPAQVVLIPGAGATCKPDGNALTTPTLVRLISELAE